ncbi:MAG: Hpt sensor hybrid histidine kinase [Pedosphaera sp.]|nr:Hpt sensor hybrid histidine kinase [Pedosphaera sp.]
MESKASSNTVSRSVYGAGGAAASDPKLAALEAALKLQQQKAVEGPTTPPPAASDSTHILPICALLLAGALTLRNLESLLNWLHSWKAGQADTVATLTPGQRLMAEDPSVTAFLNELCLGLRGELPDPERNPSGAAQPETSKDSGAEANLVEVEAFFDSASKQMAGLRMLLLDTNRTPEDAARSKALLEFSQGVGTLKQKAQLLEFIPIWLMACALEGISYQASARPSRLTPSVFRTTANGLDLLETLCLKRLNSSMAGKSPIRILAVDDNEICRRTILLALKQVFNEPDVATHGEAALALAEQQPYDVIFLDVEMPEMDGFQLCSKIHETGANRATPVVFVTSHSDFDSRVKSILTGGQELIAKPYLPSEITVKALTLVLRDRVQKAAAGPVPDQDSKA